MKIEWHKFSGLDHLCNTPTGCVFQIGNPHGTVFIPGCWAVYINETWYWKKIDEPNNSAMHPIIQENNE